MNKDLAALVKAGKFREDLYYRLSVINVTLPPLRERKEDVPELASYFLRQYSQKLSKSISGFGAGALEALTRYHWPGNVRELENVIERAVILCDSGEIGAEDLSVPAGSSDEGSRIPPLSLDEIEAEHISKILLETNGNQSRASQILGIDRKTLYLKLKKYGIG
jgi:DNA-binding NtrC family response regulator